VIEVYTHSFSIDEINGDDGAGDGVTPSNTAHLLHVLGKALFESQHPVAELGGANARWKVVLPEFACPAIV